MFLGVIGKCWGCLFMILQALSSVESHNYLIQKVEITASCGDLDDNKANISWSFILLLLCSYIFVSLNLFFLLPNPISSKSELIVYA